MIRKKYFFIATFLFAGFVLFAQNDAVIREYNKSMLTYPFSDPDPIPSENKIYPYFRFDGFSTEGEQKEWKVVELENDYIKVRILPEIGGKIWTAWEKESGEPFLYNNEEVKFRDIALRGPWVSGGIEFNYGIIGHTPNSATPVNYLTRKNEDGSVSYFTSYLDLLTRTTWVMEVKLEKDKAFFTTHSYWYNSRPEEQPYYTWMNAGIPAGIDLEFLYPGDHYIGHDGKTFKWPIDKKGRNLSLYKENNFGSSKSYHVTGQRSNYFGGYWKNKDFGMIHYASRENKLGKKIFLWAQSEQGRIWEDLLTDSSGQYVEIQSGRLFNQNVFESSLTPFKQLGFAPYSDDQWTEYWYPFKDIKGFQTANTLGAFNFEVKEEELILQFSPVRRIQDQLILYSEEGKKLQKVSIDALPLKTIAKHIKYNPKDKPAYFKLKGVKVNLQNQEAERDLDRPLTIPEEFNTESAYGLYLQGRDLYRFRNYQLAEKRIKASLDKDSLFVPALVEMAKIKRFRLQDKEAYRYARKALSIDTYNPEANYYYGLTALMLNRIDDALDGFEVASISIPLRSAAFTQMSRIYFKQGEYAQAREKALKSIDYQKNNQEALRILYMIASIQENLEQVRRLKKQLLVLNPIDHFVGFEKYWKHPNKENEERFQNLIHNELPFETYLELAIWYTSLGMKKKAQRVLEFAPEKSIGLYWLAWLYKDEEDQKKMDAYLKQAAQFAVDFAFPFRRETVEVLKWAAQKKQSWKPYYLQALIEEFHGNTEKAQSLLARIDQVDFAPFYAVKARLADNDTKSQIKLFRRAVKLAPEEWRYGKLLARTLIKQKQLEEAIDVLWPYYRANSQNYVIGMELVNAFAVAKQYGKVEKLLEEIRVLPFEGANEARLYYRQAKLMLALKAFDRGDYNLAMSKIKEAEEWPKNLGVGRPYSELIDDKLENATRALLYAKKGDEYNFKKYKKLSKGEPLDYDLLYMKVQELIKEDKKLF